MAGILRTFYMTASLSCVFQLLYIAIFALDWFAIENLLLKLYAIES